MTPLARLAAAAIPVLLLALALAGCATSEASRQLYQWTDSDGNVLYTPFPDRIPVTRQHTRRIVEPGASAVQNAADLDLPPAAAQVEGAAPVEGGDPLAARIALLEAQIATDQEALKTLISDPDKAGSLRGTPELREIGQRLPRLQAELDALRAQQAGSPVDVP